MLKATSKSILMIAMLVSSAIPSLAQLDINGFREATDSFTTSNSASNAAKTVPANKGVAFSEVLRGNGTRAGYSLSHGGVIQNTLRVSANARTLKRNIDYYIDTANGQLSFTEPVRTMDSIRVSYRYVEGQDANRSMLGSNGLALNLGGSNVSLGFGTSSGNGMDFNSFGLAMKNGLANGGIANGFYYFSNPNSNRTNVRGATSATATGKTLTKVGDAKSDRLIAQDILMKKAGVTFRAGLQDVGKNFQGFQTMKQNSAKNADALAQITNMEKEKGLKRMGFGAALAPSKLQSVGLDWDQVKDGHNSVDKMGMNVSSGLLKMKWSDQKISKGFTRFADLKETEKAQWAKEKGIHRTGLSLAFSNKMSIDQSMFGDTSGKLTRQAINLADKNTSLNYSTRKSDAKFSRMADLSDEEKAAMALDIRKQFNVAATVAEVTAKDKEQLVLDSGLERSRMALTTAVTKTTALTYNHMTLAEGKSGIARTAYSLNAKGVRFSYVDQNISDKFTRIAKLSDFEKTQFGNEMGIHRNNASLGFDVSKTAKLDLNMLSLSDKLGGLTRHSLIYAQKGIDFQFNESDTSKQFARAGDLAGLTAPQKAQIEAERGYKRNDITFNLAGQKALPGVTLNLFNYDSHNTADQMTKKNFKNNLLWAINKTSTFKMLSEGNQYATKDGMRDSFDHELLNLDETLKGKFKLNLFRDKVARRVAGVDAATVQTEFLHFESDKTKSKNFMMETKRMDLGSGKFENTDTLDVNYKSNPRLGMHFNKFTVDRGKDPSSDTNLMQFDYQSSKTLGFVTSYAQTSTNNKSDITAKSFGAKGLLTRDLNIAGNYTEVDTQNVGIKAVSDVALSNAKPINVSAMGLKALTFTARYAATNDKQKQVTEAVSGKFTALAGKNQIGLEYGGALLANGTSNQARTLSLVSDPNPKLPIHLDILYKARNINRSSVELVRKYNAAWVFGKLMTVNYSYTSMPEDPAGGMQPIKASIFALKRQMTKVLAMQIDYTTAKQLAAKTAQNKFGGMLKGNVDKRTTVDFGYSVDINDLAGASRTNSHSIRLGMDHQIDADHFINFSGTFAAYHAKQSPDALTANVEFKTLF